MVYPCKSLNGGLAVSEFPTSRGSSSWFCIRDDFMGELGCGFSAT